MQLTTQRKQIIVGVTIFLMCLLTMYAFDDQVSNIFKKHPVQEEHPITQIDVSGDGSSGTGDVTNTVVVQKSGGGTTTVKGVVTAPPKQTEPVYPSSGIDSRGTAD